MTSAIFKKIVWRYYQENRRFFPWRETRDPYKILVSEIMLQQTQAPRVVEKYERFIKQFPSFKALATARLATVLKEWQGLGYNRRGMALKKAAEIIISDHKGKMPRDYETLLTLPGIGPATAGDILAFAYNIPTVVIETNIRTVFIHCFFEDRRDIHDKEILPLIKKTLDRDNPREWYFALMDYGAMLKKTLPNPGRRSRHYTRQSAFKGSNREQRSKILKYLLAYGRQSAETVAEALGLDKAAALLNLKAMSKEGVIAVKKSKDIEFFYVP